MEAPAKEMGLIHMNRIPYSPRGVNPQRAETRGPFLQYHVDQ